MRSRRIIRWTLLPAIALLACAAIAQAAGHTAVARTGRTHHAVRTPLGVFGRAGNNHVKAHVVGRLSRDTTGGGHYLYAEDGTCPDGIDVFKKVAGTDLTNIQNVQAGCTVGTYYGAHHLAVVRSPANCLILSSDGDGTVDSFTIDSSTGMLSSTPASSAYVGGYPQDLAVSGSTVYESNSNPGNPSPTIDVLTVGSGCVLTLDSQNSTGTENDINIALTSPTTVVSTDNNSGDMVAYTLQGDGTLAETTKDPGQIQSPESVAAADTGNGNAVVFTGQATQNPPQTQGFAFTSGGNFVALKGSPQTSSDPRSAGGAAVALSIPNRLLLQAEGSSGQIGWDTLNASQGMQYAGDTGLAHADFPAEITVAGNNLLVAQIFNGDLEDCALATSGVSGCHTIATLTGAGNGYSGSTAIF